VQVDKNIRALKDPMKKIVERHRYQNKQYDRHFRDCPSNDQKPPSLFYNILIHFNKK